MKRFLVALTAACLCAPAFSALPVQSLVSNSQDECSFSVRPEAKVTRIGGKTAGLAGIAMGPAMDRTFYFTLAGHALLNSLSTDEPNAVDMSFFNYWDAGLNLNYTFFSSQVIHGDVQCLMGGGRATYDYTLGGSDSSTVFILEPEVDLLVNLTSTFELGLGVGYRFAAGASGDKGLASSDLSSLTGTLSLRWTEFW